MADRPQPAHGLDFQLYLRLDERFDQFRRDGDVFEQQRLRQRAHAPRARRPPAATSAPTTTIRWASSARRPTSPTPATAPTNPATRRRKCCSSSPTASRTSRAARAASNRRSTISAGTLTRLLTATCNGNQLVHDDQESRNQDRDPLHRLSGGASQQLVREPYRSVPIPASAPTSQACATPGLFIDEANDANIGQDLAKLFNLAAAPGHLTQ